MILLAALGLACAQGYQTGFDSGSAGWSLDAPASGCAWAVDATPASFPFGISRSGLSLNFNNGTDYAGGTSGTATSPLISLAGLANPVLVFWCNYQTETRGTASDRRTVQIWNRTFSTMLAEWQLASVGYTFNPTGGIVGGGPGPCAEAYNDLETGAPVATWHPHRVFLDPAWSDVHVRFVFWSVDDLRNTYAGWAIDDFSVASHPVPALTTWPDAIPDYVPNGSGKVELDICERRPGQILRWSWGTTIAGDVGVDLIVGDHDRSILDRAFMFYDPVHLHWHLSQFVDVAIWKSEAFGFRKLRRGPKRSFCLADVENIIPGWPSTSPFCGRPYESISYGWQDIYPIYTSGQYMDISGLADSTDYYLVGIVDPLNRMRETNEMNQTDNIHFTMPVDSVSNTQVAIIDRTNLYPPTATAITITAASTGTFQGVPAVQMLGTGFDSTLVPVLYDAGTGVSEAPFFTIVSAGEIWVEVPVAIATPTTIDLLRPRGDSASFRIGGPAPTPTPAPAAPAPGPLVVAPASAASFAGPEGGPFSPASVSYTLSNGGTAPIAWTAAAPGGWLTFTPAWGSLAAGESVTVAVAAGPAAAALAVGPYADTITFTNGTNGSGTTTRSADLTVNVAPTVSVITPPTMVIGTPLVVNGTASGAGPLTVTWSNSATGQTGTATGTTTWSASIPLAGGVNPITITVTDGMGYTATSSFSVRRRVGSGSGGGCGATGLEAILLLALLRKSRRAARRGPRRLRSLPGRAADPPASP